MISKDYTIVFILSTQENTNNIKRIDEFVENGYDVLAYSFFRNTNIKNKPKTVPIVNIGEFGNDTPYRNRIGIMKRGIKRVLDETKGKKCIYYLIRTEVALVYMFLSNRPYIYEEADMTHVTFNNRCARSLFEYLDKRIVRKSIVSVFRSEGFVAYHYGDKAPENVYVIPNRLDSSILSMQSIEKTKAEDGKIRFGFVGVIRYQAILRFSEILLKNFPNYEMHFYGVFGTEKTAEEFKVLEKYGNCFFHGGFVSPRDLPEIYSNIDLVVSTYDATGVNRKYAEPNKLYEAIYFNSPIVVTSGTFLAKKVNSLGIGYDIDVEDEGAIYKFLSELSVADMKEKSINASKIDRSYCVNENSDFFVRLESLCQKKGL